jgi:enoyl-CoA hydratase/carnithine racemase
MGVPELLVEQDDGGILQLTLNRPDELNAWTYGMEAAFFAALDGAVTDPGVRAVVITGAGRGFCAGASMSLLGGTSPERPDLSVRRRLTELTLYPKPLIAAINGPAAGIGFALAISCDIRIVASDAVMTTSFARLGLVAEHGVSWLLPRLVGRARALDLLLSARAVKGEEAEAIGLANRNVPADQALRAARDYASMLVERTAPSSWAVIKRQLLEADECSLPVAYERAAELMDTALASADHREGVAAFREKRSPRFAPLVGWP